MLPKILVVEDSPEVQILVKSSLGSAFQVTQAPTMAEAIDLTTQFRFDLFVIDIGLPDGSGFQLCAHLKQDDLASNVPVIFLTGRADLRDKLMGFSLGADDYVVKPFEPLELRARVKAKLQHIRNSVELRAGKIKVNVPALKAFSFNTSDEEEDLGLSPNEFRLLYFFMTHEGHLLSRNQLINRVWGEKLHVTERTVDTHVYTLRRKMGHCSTYIESVFGEGYRFASSPAHPKG